MGPSCTPFDEVLYYCEGTQHFRELLAGVDVIIDESYVDDNASYTLDDFIFNCGGDAADFSATLPEAVFHFAFDTAANERMSAQPQEFLSDMMHAIWGSSFQGPCEYTHLRSLYGHGGTQAPWVSPEHTDCPMYDPLGTHDCEAIHDYEHQVHRCAFVTT
eukprot:1379458-Amphidinium_carterae.2